MAFYKTFDNGLRLVVQKIEGLMSVSIGVLVKTGSINETEAENGISHFIEHNLFKGTEKRSAFEISDHVDRIGGQINAFTSKELTCYYTKVTSDHTEESLEILSDIFFNSVFDDKEMEKEKGVIIEEINMSEDSPEDICLDLLAESFYGKEGLGRTILGSAKNVKSFTKADVLAYMDKYYTADNVVISVAGNVDEKAVEELVNKYFAQNFKRLKSAPQVKTKKTYSGNLIKTKKIEQAHIGFCMSAPSINDSRTDAISLSNLILGGGMSSRLFQRVREELGLCYSVYSYVSQYKDSGVIEICGGVNINSRDLAVKEIIDVVNKFNRDGITEQEFLRGKEQMKSAFIMGQESTASQMLLYGKYLLVMEKEFDFKDRIEQIQKLTFKEVNDVVSELYRTDKMAVATVGPSKKRIKI